MSTTTIRPSRSLGSSNAAASAGTFHACTSDDADGTYVRISGGGSQGDFSIGFAAVTIPAGAVLKTISPRVRAKSSVASSDQSIELGYSESYDAGFVWDTANIGTSFTTRTGPSFSPRSTTYIFNTGPKTSIQDDLNHLTLNSYAATDGGNVDFAEIYLDLVWALPPITAVSSPSGAQATSTVTGVWTYSQADSDGGAQSAYQVKVFSAAQYGVSGFDPSTSPSTYDSGTLTGAATSLAIPTGLTDGVSYRCYVRTAQTTSGTAQWSDWAFSSFSISIPPASLPGTPTLTVTGQSTLSRLKVLITNAAADGTYFELQRSTDAGATWAALTDVDFSGRMGIHYDYATESGVTYTYRARAVSVVGSASYSGSWSSSVSGSWTAPVDPAAGGIAYAWLRHPSDTTLTVRVTLVFGSFKSVTRAASRGLYRVIGRENVVAVEDVRQGRAGAFEIAVCDSSTTPAADRAAIIAIFKSQSVLKLEPDAGTGIDAFWFSAGDLVENRPVTALDSEVRTFTVPFNEVDEPYVDPTVTASTWADVMAEWADWTAVGVAQADWATLIGWLP